jgi:hypothetical protein
MDIEREIACLKLNVVAITHHSDRRGVRRLAVTLWGFPCHGPWPGQHRALDHIYSGELCWQVWANPSIREGPGRKGRGTFSELSRGLGEEFIGGCDDFWGEERLKGSGKMPGDAVLFIQRQNGGTYWHLYWLQASINSVPRREWVGQAVVFEKRRGEERRG